MRNKDTVLIDFKDMIFKSWTYARLTQKEKEQLDKTFNDVPTKEALKGSYIQRWHILQAIYTSYLNALGYDPINWENRKEQ